MIPSNPHDCMIESFRTTMHPWLFFTGKKNPEGFRPPGLY
jgi:hypothetical protein